MYINIIGDANFAENLDSTYGKVSPISTFKDTTCTSFTLNSTEITLTALGQKFELVVSQRTPASSVDEPIYAVADNSIASVDSGMITALKKGTTEIFVYLGNAYQKVSLTVDTSSSVLPIEYNSITDYFTEDGEWATSQGTFGVKGVRVEPNSVYSITRSSSYQPWRAAEGDRLSNDAVLSNLVELGKIDTEATYTIYTAIISDFGHLRIICIEHFLIFKNTAPFCL
jgi:hypothetical protein